jgi:V-type H+-transporting ATPase subunit a
VNEYRNHNIKRPTYIKTNGVTAVYQLIVDTYGIPTYLEANPALLTIITFPFFFGMMFGDMGHGSILLVLGAYLVFFPDAFKGTQAAGASSARYLLLLMGIMATYCGFIYNEWFAIPTNMFGSCYLINEHTCATPLKQEP